MNKLLRFEFRKLIKAKSFYVCSIIAAVMTVLSINLANALAAEGVGSFTFNGLIKASLNNGMVMTLMAIFTAMFVSEDEQSGTLKNIYGRGYSRGNVFAAKYIAGLFAAIVFAFLSIGVTVAYGSSLASDGHITSAIVYNLLGQGFVMLGYYTLYFSISMLVGKGGSAIAGCVVGPALIGTVFSMADSFLKLDNIRLSNYWLENAFVKLQGDSCVLKDVYFSISLAITYTIIVFVVGRCLNKKKSL